MPLRPEDEESQHGMQNVTMDRIGEVLPETDVLVCLLPLTAETQDIVDAAFLARLKRGAVFVNAARGQHVKEEDLVAALDSGVACKCMPSMHGARAVLCLYLHASNSAM